MSIATLLGVESVSTPTIREAQHRWQDWVRMEPVLDIGVDLVDLPAWSWTRDTRTDDVYRALARVGSPRGHNDPLATSVLAWLLIPGATSVARQLQAPPSTAAAAAVDNADELVAPGLWVACREVEWERPAPIAPSILRVTRRTVQNELGFGEGSRKADRTWAAAIPFDPQSGEWVPELDPTETTSTTSARELLELLDSATRAGVVTAADCQLLLDLALATDELEAGPGVRARRESCGLGTRAAATAVAGRLGVSEVTVRRRLHRCLNQLTDFATGPSRDLAAA